MNTWIALLRGINVGGHHKLPMHDLKTLLGTLGFADIQTYIQSGNVVFRSRATDAIEMANSIQQAIDDGFGFAPDVLVISLDDLSETVHQNPFREAERDHKTLHVSFAVEAPASPDRGAPPSPRTWHSPQDAAQRAVTSAVMPLLAGPDGGSVGEVAQDASNSAAKEMMTMRMVRLPGCNISSSRLRRARTSEGQIVSLTSETTNHR